MEATFSPGPWKIVERELLEDGGVYPKHIVGGVAEFQVCLLEGPAVAQIRHENPGWCSTVTGDKNADLIAASPDMLLALQEVLKTPGLQSGLQALCAAAIAKATGRDVADVVKATKFPEVYCSQCGGAFGPGDHGFSHCHSHQDKTRVD